MSLALQEERGRKEAPLSFYYISASNRSGGGGGKWKVVRHGNFTELVPIYPRVRGGGTSPESKPRGRVKGMSAASRGRLLGKLGRAQGLETCLTLTYGQHWRAAAGSPQASKKALSNFHGRLRGEFPVVEGGIWLQEFQQRGAPHYTLLLAEGKAPEAKELQEREDWAQWAWQAYGGGRFVQWKPVENHDALAIYLTKGTQKEAPKAWEAGRYWGEFGKVDYTSAVEAGEFTLEELQTMGVRLRRDGLPYRMQFPTRGEALVAC